MSFLLLFHFFLSEKEFIPTPSKKKKKKIKFIK